MRNVALKAPQSGSDGWTEWGNHVLAEMIRLNDAYENIRGEVVKIHIELATLKVKSGVWGAIGALVPITLAIVTGIIIWYVKNNK